MKESPSDDRAPLARAFDQAIQVSTIAMMMVLPVLPGYWLDGWLGTLPLFTVLGLVLGMAVAISQLVKFVNRTEKQAEANAEKSGDTQADNQSDG